MTSQAESSAQEATVKDLIQSRGIPPSDICLDWAWQLRQLVQQTRSELSAQSRPTPTTRSVEPHLLTTRSVEPHCRQSYETEDNRCDWSKLTLDASGQLHWAANAVANTIARDALCASWLQQLSCWCDSANATPGGTRGVLTLEQRTLDWGQAQDAIPRAGNATSSAASTASSVAQAKRLRCPTSSASRLATKSQPIRRSRPARSKIRQTALAGGLSGLFLASAVIYRKGSYHAGPPLDAAQLSTENLSSNAFKPLAAIPFSDSSIDPGAAFPHHSPMLSTDTFHQASIGNAAGDSSSPSFPLSAGPAPSASESKPSVGEPASGSSPPAMIVTEPTTGETGTLASPIELADFDLTAQRDVLSELASLSKSAEANASEHLLPKATSAAAPNEPAPLALKTSPMVQLQQLDRSFRPRQALWQLRLAASDGLVVMPATAQTLAEDQLLSWTIRALELDKSAEREFPARQFPGRGTGPKPGSSVVLVQVQLAGKRDPSLRWRIVAASEKYAQVALPLDRLWLDQSQDFLSNAASGLQQQVQQLKELGRSTGLPSQTRSALSGQSRAMETQRKLATDLLEIVADANQLVGWMDGHIEVHGELLDTAASPSTALLQFGDP